MLMLIQLMLYLCDAIQARVAAACLNGLLESLASTPCLRVPCNKTEKRCMERRELEVRDSVGTVLGHTWVTVLVVTAYALAARALYDAHTWQ